MTSDPPGTTDPSGNKAPAAMTDPVPTTTRSVQQNRPDPHETVVLDGTPMEHGSVANPHTPSDGAGDAFVNVNDGHVLKVGLISHRDRRHISADDSVVPHAGIFAEGHVAQDHGSRVSAVWAEAEAASRPLSACRPFERA
jgi:hypothetical protein